AAAIGGVIEDPVGRSGASERAVCIGIDHSGAACEVDGTSTFVGCHREGGPGGFIVAAGRDRRLGIVFSAGGKGDVVAGETVSGIAVAASLVSEVPSHPVRLT